MNNRCHGVRISGLWRGKRCCAVAKYLKGQQWFCKNHLPIDYIVTASAAVIEPPANISIAGNCKITLELKKDSQNEKI